MSSDKSSGLVQGTLDMLILKTLALEPMHGYGIGVRLDPARAFSRSTRARSSLRSGVSSATG
jgi:hypothetical protein